MVIFNRGVSYTWRDSGEYQKWVHKEIYLYPITAHKHLPPNIHLLSLFSPLIQFFPSTHHPPPPSLPPSSLAQLQMHTQTHPLSRKLKFHFYFFHLVEYNWKCLLCSWLARFRSSKIMASGHCFYCLLDSSDIQIPTVFVCVCGNRIYLDSEFNLQCLYYDPP